MENSRKARIRDMVSSYARAAHFDNEEEINKLVDQLETLSDEEVVTKTVILIGRMLDSKRISREDVIDNVDKVLAIAPDKYKSIEDLLDLFKHIKQQNMLYTATTVEENHRLVMETFDKFNGLLEGQYLDCYYTGGLMGYIITDTPLERYHSDLDVLVNEEDLLALKKLVDSNPDFSFDCHMDGKGDNGHEFVVRYKDSPMAIGLFLFTRDRDGTLVNKSYYYDKDSRDLMCKAEYRDEELSESAFEKEERIYKEHPYKIMGLEYMYALKASSYRDKDLYDAKLIEPRVDVERGKELIKHVDPIYEERVIVGGGVVKNLIDEMEVQKKK